MPITVNCSCGKVLRVKDEMAGKKGKCPACGAILTIPAAEFEAPPMEFEAPEASPPITEPPQAGDQEHQFDDYGVDVKEYKARDDVEVDLTNCPNCGADLGEGQDICLNCGTNVKTGQKIAVGPGVQLKTEKKMGTFNMLAILVAILAILGVVWVVMKTEEKKKEGAGGEETAAVETSTQQAAPAAQQKAEATAQEQVTAPPQELSFDMVAIPAGQFIVGDNKGEPDEAPQRSISVNAFMIDKYEVTNKQYKEFVDATGHPAPKHPSDPSLNIWDIEKKTYPPQLEYHPVVNVSWEDANAYARWAGKRLPTEAEWERAARYTDGRAYPWGAKFEKANANVFGTGTQHVASFEKGASPEGVFNLAGNVWEWTANSYIRYPGSQDEKGNYSKDLKVIRGGSWMYDEKFARGANRSWHCAGTKGAIDIGFRCVKSGTTVASAPPAQQKAAVAPQPAESNAQVANVLSLIGKKQSVIKDVAANMRTEMSLMGNSITSDAKIYYKKPNLLRNEATSSAMGMTTSQLTVSNGKTLWVQTSMGAQVTVRKMDASKLQGAGMMAMSNPFTMLTKANMVDWQSVNKSEFSGVPVYVLEGKLKTGSMPQGLPGMGNLKDMMSTLRLYVGQKDGFTHKIEMFDSKGNKVTSVEFSDVRLNGGLKDDLFSYKPPAGAKVQDMGAMMKQMQGMGPGGQH